MPIEVLCPGCKTRFKVSDKFAGKKGPCPKCKAVITVPEKTAEVVVHAPEEFGPKNAAGRGSAQADLAQGNEDLAAGHRGYPRRDHPGAGGRRCCCADIEEIPPWVLGDRARCCSPRRWCLGGYTFLRDDELEPYRGLSLIVRVLICSVRLRRLVGRLRVAAGAGLNLDTARTVPPAADRPAHRRGRRVRGRTRWTSNSPNAVIHYGLYVLVTVVLCVVIGVNLHGDAAGDVVVREGTGSAMSGIGDIPEIQGLDRRQHLIRIPQECDVPLTPRVRQLIDTAEFRRLGRISQLGLVALVYPGGASHAVRAFAGRVPPGAAVSAAAGARRSVRRHWCSAGMPNG